MDNAMIFCSSSVLGRQMHLPKINWIFESNRKKDPNEKLLHETNIFITSE